eukprot:4831-Hanusia_phi.AAC.4
MAFQRGAALAAAFMSFSPVLASSAMSPATRLTDRRSAPLPDGLAQATWPGSFPPTLRLRGGATVLEDNNCLNNWGDADDRIIAGKTEEDIFPGQAATFHSGSIVYDKGEYYYETVDLDDMEFDEVESVGVLFDVFFPL